MSLFITFEGGEGSGKSVQARALYRKLLNSGVPVLLTHEPGGTPLGDRITRWLKWGGTMGISPAAELMLFNASRAQLVAEVIRPGLESGKVVICDRFMDSTTAYQGYGRGLDLAMVKTVNAIAVQGLNPHLTILMDLDVETGLTRKGKKKQDRFEREEIAFHRRVREGYLKLAREEPGRWLVLDAAQAKNKISAKVWRKVSQMLAGKHRA